MIENTGKIEIRGKTLDPVRVELPGADLILIKAPKGFLMCGYLDITVPERLGSAAGIISGVDSVRSMLDQPVVKITSAARRLGVRTGMSGQEALEFFL